MLSLSLSLSHCLSPQCLPWPAVGRGFKLGGCLLRGKHTLIARGGARISNRALPATRLCSSHAACPWAWRGTFPRFPRFRVMRWARWVPSTVSVPCSLCRRADVHTSAHTWYAADCASDKSSTYVLTKPKSVFFPSTPSHVCPCPACHANARTGGGGMQGGMEAALSVGLGVGSTLCTAAGLLRRVLVVVGCAARVPWLHTRENVTRSHPGWAGSGGVPQ